jgi:CheY-like chemotaxis protein
MTQPSSLLLVDSDLHGLETLTYGFEREGCKVTRTSDLSRAVQLSRTGAPGLATVMLREPTQPALEVIAALHGVHRDMPILALGEAALQTAARAAGASDFLRIPTYIRDVVNVAKLNAYGDDGEGLLSEYHGLFYLLRAMSATSRSCVLRLSRGPRRGEIRFKEGKVVSAGVRSLQHLPAIHHMLLWEEARVSIAGGPVSKPSQFPLSAQEILDECERFLRDFAHAARDLGPPNTIYHPVDEPRPPITGLQPNQMAPLLRLFDGKHGLADVVEESPFRIFDTIRMIRRLVEGGVLTTRTTRRPTGQHQRISRPVVPLNGTAPQSMLGQWAMVPDQRGVVGDRRSPARPLMPFGGHAPDQPGAGRDRRSGSQPVKPLATPGPTPLPTPVPAPIPLTHKKVPSGGIAATAGEIPAVKDELPAVTGEIPAVKRRSTPADLAVLALEPTVQVKVDPDGAPVELPPLRPTATPAPMPVPVSEPPPRAVVRSHKTPIPARVTPAAAFDAVEADFFAREADLYKRESVETFDDLDPGGGDSRPSKPRRRRK